MSVELRSREKVHLTRIRSSANTVLQYDSDKHELATWLWYVPHYTLQCSQLTSGISRPSASNGELVKPLHLNEYCRTHDVPAPCCLCPLASKIHVSSVGEYVAVCAQGKCGYYGVFI
jgi:hypothetical protein